MLKTFWQKLKAILKKIAFFQSRILLFLIYFIFITPVAILFRIFADPLNLKKKASWFSAVEQEKELSQMKDQ